MFERSFEGPYVDESQEPEKPKPIYTEDEMQAAKNEAFEAGRTAGRGEALDAEVARQSGLVTNLGQHMQALMTQTQALAKEQLGHMEQVALLIARKILPSFIAREGETEVKEIVEKILANMAREPRLVVRVAEDSFETAKDKIQEAATRAAFAGQVVVLSDPTFGPSDCRIEWADGGVERDLKKIWEDIGHVMEANGAGQSLSFEETAPEPLDDRKEPLYETETDETEDVNLEPPSDPSLPSSEKTGDET